MCSAMLFFLEVRPDRYKETQFLPSSNRIDTAIIFPLFPIFLIQYCYYITICRLPKFVISILLQYHYKVEWWNCRPRKDDMIPFPFNENRFSFFVADHLLVGQLCTNPKSDRNLLSCLKVTQCSTSKIGDVPLYNSCSLPIQIMTTGSLPALSKCKSGRFNAWGQSTTHWTTLWRWWSRRLHHATSHLRSRLESQEGVLVV